MRGLSNPSQETPLKKLVLAALAAAAAAAATGCATGPEASAEQARAPREYITGSNVGRRPGEAPTDQVKLVHPETLRDARWNGGQGSGATPGTGN
jgi:hypothetical protein